MHFVDTQSVAGFACSLVELQIVFFSCLCVCGLVCWPCYLGSRANHGAVVSSWNPFLLFLLLPSFVFLLLPGFVFLLLPSFVCISVCFPGCPYRGEAVAGSWKPVPALPAKRLEISAANDSLAHWVKQGLGGHFHWTTLIFLIPGVVLCSMSATTIQVADLDPQIKMMPNKP